MNNRGEIPHFSLGNCYYYVVYYVKLFEIVFGYFRLASTSSEVSASQLSCNSSLRGSDVGLPPHIEVKDCPR